MAYTNLSQSRIRKAEDNQQHNMAVDLESQLLLDGKRLIGIERFVDEEELKRMVGELIDTYDNPFNSSEIREKAFCSVSSLARQNDLVLDSVISNARRFIETQYIDDASPYSPNSFDVLSEIGKGNPKSISFLKDTLQNEWGIPRWEAIKALCKLNDPQADKIIYNLVQGAYPPKFLDLRMDLDKIRRLRPDFLNNAWPS
jgi:hypothetical protein